MAASEQSPEVPEGMTPDAKETWPHPELIQSWLGDADFDVEWRPGEGSAVHADDPEAVAAARRFRNALGRFATGVAVVTAQSNGEPVGMTCQSFSSVSLDPPLVLFVPARTSRAWPVIQRAGRFCVNFLSAEQSEISNRMATRGIDKFAGVDWRPSVATGSPLLDGVVGYVDCAVHAVHEGGDHYVVIGKVLDLDDAGPDEPLLFYRGRYATTTDERHGHG